MDFYKIFTQDLQQKRDSITDTNTIGWEHSKEDIVFNNGLLPLPTVQESDRSLRSKTETQ